MPHSGAGSGAQPDEQALAAAEQRVPADRQRVLRTRRLGRPVRVGREPCQLAGGLLDVHVHLSASRGADPRSDFA